MRRKHRGDKKERGKIQSNDRKKEGIKETPEKFETRIRTLKGEGKQGKKKDRKARKNVTTLQILLFGKVFTT